MTDNLDDAAPRVVELHGEEANFTHVFFCEGCMCAHGFNVDAGKDAPCWQWDGDVVNPTISPSILVRWPQLGKLDRICHSFVTNGHIQYLADSTHHLSGQTVRLTPVLC